MFVEEEAKLEQEEPDQEPDEDYGPQEKNWREQEQECMAKGEKVAPSYRASIESSNR